MHPSPLDGLPLPVCRLLGYAVAAQMAAANLRDLSVMQVRRRGRPRRLNPKVAAALSAAQLPLDVPEAARMIGLSQSQLLRRVHAGVALRAPRMTRRAKPSPGAEPDDL